MIGEYEAKLLEYHSGHYYGLWEFDAQLDSDRFDDDREERIALLKTLVGAGLLEIYFGTANHAPKPLPLAEAWVAISDPKNWLPPSKGDQQVLYLTTSAAGQEVVRQRAEA